MLTFLLPPGIKGLKVSSKSFEGSPDVLFEEMITNYLNDQIKKEKNKETLKTFYTDSFKRNFVTQHETRKVTYVPETDSHDRIKE